MSNYTYPNSSLTFGQRDTLSPGSTEKVVKGSQLDFEFNALVTSVNSKLNTLNPIIEGDLTGPSGARIIGGTY